MAAPDIETLFADAVRHHLAQQLDEAERLYRRIAVIAPDHAGARHLLGVLAHQTGRREVALGHIAKAITLDCEIALFHSNLGAVHKDAGDADLAAKNYRRALILQPNHADALSNLGDALWITGHGEAAVAACRRALSLLQNHLQAHFNLANCLRSIGKLADAVTSYRRAIAIRPDYLEAICNLAIALMEQGRPIEAAACGEQAITLQPDCRIAHNNLLMALHYDADATGEQLLAAARRFGRTFSSSSIATFARNGSSHRRLRVGYVSGDFRKHPVGYFLARILPAHRRSFVEIFCYSNSALTDAMTERLRAASDHWRSLVGRTDEDAEKLIRADGIDILIDLSGHTSGNRLSLFARKPAPIQASWLGYYGTTGVPAIDYVIMDATAVPRGDDRFYSEAVVRLPNGRFCYDPPDDAPAIMGPPCILGRPLTFGSFNNTAKIGTAVIGLWSSLLAAAPGSRLILKWETLEDQAARRRLTEAFWREGVDETRLDLRGKSTHRRMLAEYGDIDIALDPFPFGGGLTSCEALYMGVPVITLQGDRPASRQAAGFLSQLDMADLVAESPADYILRALQLAADADRLTELRQSLRSRMLASSLCDGPLFAAGLEAAYHTMWRRWQAGQKAASFDLPGSGHDPQME